MVYGGDFDHPSIPELSPLRRHVLYSLKPLTGTRSPHQFASWFLQKVDNAVFHLPMLLAGDSCNRSVRLWDDAIALRQAIVVAEAPFHSRSGCEPSASSA